MAIPSHVLRGRNLIKSQNVSSGRHLKKILKKTLVLKSRFDFYDLEKKPAAAILFQRFARDRRLLYPTWKTERLKHRKDGMSK